MLDLPPIPAIMDETQYSVDNTSSPPQNEPLAMGSTFIGPSSFGNWNDWT